MYQFLSLMLIVAVTVLPHNFLKVRNGEMLVKCSLKFWKKILPSETQTEKEHCLKLLTYTVQYTLNNIIPTSFENINMNVFWKFLAPNLHMFKIIVLYQKRVKYGCFELWMEMWRSRDEYVRKRTDGKRSENGGWRGEDENLETVRENCDLGMSVSFET